MCACPLFTSTLPRFVELKPLLKLQDTRIARPQIV
jgi:hypothetical protein